MHFLALKGPATRGRGLCSGRAHVDKEEGHAFCVTSESVIQKPSEDLPGLADYSNAKTKKPL